MATIELGVPAKIYGNCQFFIPDPIVSHIRKLTLSYSYAGLRTTYNDATRNYSDDMHIFTLYDVEPEDSIVIKFKFPHCRIKVLD